MLISYSTNNGLVWFGEYVTDDKLISALAGGVLVGFSIGLIMRMGSTSGGTDIIVRVLRKKYPHIKTSAIFSIVDFGIVAASAIVFKDIIVALYACIAVAEQNVVLDKVLYGSDEAKLVFIISDKSSEIAVRLLKDVDLTAFLIFTSANEIYGKGYKNIFSDKL